MVSLCRDVRPGTKNPPMVTPRAGSTSLTSEASLRWMVLSSITVGVKFRMMPNFFQLTEVWPKFVDIGTGNSPPARNLASCPDSETRVGSARILARPFDSSRLTMADSGNRGMPEKNREKAPVRSGG